MQVSNQIYGEMSAPGVNSWEMAETQDGVQRVDKYLV